MAGHWEDNSLTSNLSWVYAYRFRYAPKEIPPRLLPAHTAVEAGGSPASTRPFTLTGQCYVTDPQWRKGEFVRVRYLRRDPPVACPVGARRNARSAWYMFALAPLPAIAAGLATLNWIRRRRGARLITEGEVVQAKVKEVHTFALQPKGEYRRHGVTRRQTTDEGVINHQVTVIYADDASRRYLARVSTKRDAAFTTHDAPLSGPTGPEAHPCSRGRSARSGRRSATAAWMLFPRCVESTGSRCGRPFPGSAARWS